MRNLTPLLMFSLLLASVRGLAQSPGEVAETNKIGVLFSSFGDIDDPSEARDYVIRTLSDPFVLPLPGFLRWKLANLGWTLREPQIRAAYQRIGWKTHYRENSQKQAQLVAGRLKELGLNARAYIGFTFTFPFIEDALAQAERDGINTLIVVNQGAQYARVTTGIEFRNVRSYLARHDGWRVKALGIRQFAKDPRFVKLLAKSIQRRIDSSFPQVSAQDLCIFLPMHGNLQQSIDAGDPSIDQMLSVVRGIQDKFPGHVVSHGFLNHDEMPFFKWSEPKDSVALKDLVQRGCPNILINGRISFTIDSIESLHDQVIEETRIIQEEAKALGFTAPKVTVESMFNSDWEFVRFQANIIKEALMGQGDLEAL